MHQKKKRNLGSFLKVNLELLYANEIDSGPSESFVQFWLHNTLNSRKSVRWSAVPVPCSSRLWFKLRGEQGSGPNGADDLCFHTYGEFSPSPPPGIGSHGWDLDL